MNHALHKQFTVLLRTAGHTPRNASLLAGEALGDLPKLLTPAGAPDDLERWRNEGGPGYAPNPFELALQNDEFFKAAQLAQQTLHPALHELLILVAENSRDDPAALSWSALLTSTPPQRQPRDSKAGAV